MVSLNLILILQKTSHTASTKMKILAKYNNFITMSLLLLINCRSPSRILLLNHMQYNVSSLVFNCSFGGLLTVHYGEVMEKLQEAVRYNDQHNLTVSISKKKLPNVNKIMTLDVQTQTDFLPTCTIERFYSIYNGGMYGELSKILDILNSGYGCLHVDNSLILINFNMESKSFNQQFSCSVVFEERIERAKKVN